MIKLILPWPPSSNRYWRYVSNHPVVSQEAREYRDRCGWMVREQLGAFEPLTGLIAVTMHFYRPRKSGDLDNRIKISLDALRGIVYDDDKGIIEIHAYQHEDKLNPRIELEILELFKGN